MKKNKDNKDYDEPISEIFKQLNAKANIIFRFVSLYTKLMNVSRDYGTGEVVNMVEVHSLTEIEENPGIGINELAASWYKTKGAASQTVSKLVENGYVYKETNSNNAKKLHLYATERGVNLSRAHKDYDTASITRTMQELNKTCSPQEINAFYKVLGQYIAFLEEKIKSS